MGPSGPRGSLAPMSEQQREIRVGLLGCGNVGGALVPLVAERADEIARRTGVRLSIERVAVRNTARDRGIDFGDGVLTHDAMSVVTDPDIDVVVEVIGGIEPPRRSPMSPRSRSPRSGDTASEAAWYSWPPAI